MIEVDYRRWGVFKSKQTIFSDKIPSTKGYHFVICTYCYNELQGHHFDKRVAHKTVTIDLLQDSDEILANVNKNKRKMIRRGLKMGYEVIPLVPTTSLLTEFKRIYNKAMVKKGAAPIRSLYFFIALIPYTTILQITYEKHILGMMLLVHDGKTVKAHRLAYNDDAIVDKKIRDNMGDALWWQAIIYFKQLGYQTFDFGGIRLEDVSSEQGYTRFKMSFGGKITSIYWYEIAVTPMARVAVKVMKVLTRIFKKLL